MRPLLFALFALVCAPAQAHEFKSGALTAVHPWIRMPPPGASTAAGYVSITNAKPEPVILTRVESAIRASLHKSETLNGVSRMMPMPEGLIIEPSTEAALAPGGVHIMFVNPPQSLAVGGSIPATLVFSSGDHIGVEFKIEPTGFVPPSPPLADHKGH